MRLSHDKFIRRALEGPPPAPSPRDAALEAIPQLRGIADKRLDSFQDVLDQFGIRGEPKPLESVSYMDPISGVRRFGWVVPGGHPENGFVTVAIDDGDYVLVPPEAVERTGRKTDEEKERFRHELRASMGLDAQQLTYRADLQEMREPSPLNAAGDHQLNLQYNTMFGTPSDEDIRRFLASKYPEARYLDADASLPGRIAVMVHVAAPPPKKFPTPRKMMTDIGPAEYQQMRERHQEEPTRKRRRDLRLDPKFREMYPDVPPMPASQDIYYNSVDLLMPSSPPDPSVGETPPGTYQFGPAAPEPAPAEPLPDWLIPEEKPKKKEGGGDGTPPFTPRQPGAQGEELQGTGHFGELHTAEDYQAPVNTSPVMDPSGGVQAPYSSGSGALSTREDAPGEYRMAADGDGEMGSTEAVMPALTGGELVERFDPKVIEPAKKARRPRGAERGAARRTAAPPIQRARSLKELAESLQRQYGTDPTVRSAVDKAVGAYLAGGGMQQIISRGQISSLQTIGEALKFLQGTNQKQFQTLTTYATRGIEMMKPGKPSGLTKLDKDTLTEAWQLYQQEKKRKLPPIPQMTPKQIEQLEAWWAAEHGTKGLGTPYDQVGPEQSPESAGTVASRGRRTAAPSAMGKHNLPPSTMDVHRMLRVDKVVARGDYLIATIVWDPKDFEGTSSPSLKQMVLSYTKAQASFRDRQFDWGHIGRPRFLVFDDDAGVAELAIRSSNAKAFQQEVVVRSEAPEYRQRYV